MASAKRQEKKKSRVAKSLAHNSPEATGNEPLLPRFKSSWYAKRIRQTRMAAAVND